MAISLTGKLLQRLFCFSLLLTSWGEVVVITPSQAIAQVNSPSSQLPVITPENPLPDVITPEKQPPQATPPEDTTFTIRLVVKRRRRKVIVYRGKEILATYPIAVGKPGWETPLGKFRVFNMEKDPIFKSFKTGKMIPPGPENPLGNRWIGIWTDGKTQLGFHGTNQEYLIGKAVSHGCIRMRNRDVMALYELVTIGTPVTVEP